MYERKQISILKKRLAESRKFIQIILGPRQVGKTTLVNQLIQKMKGMFSFTSTDGVTPGNTFWIDQQWDALRWKLNNSKSKTALLIIDEIQKLENWSEVVKKNWDKDTRNGINIKLLLLGSSSLSIQKGLTESLTGRFEVIKLPHWSFREMKEAFGFSPEEYVYFGAYPGAAELIKSEKRWKNYILDSIVETTVSRDILQLTTIQKPALLKNLFELGCIYSGEILSYNKILGQLHDAGNTTTLRHYQELLDKTWMLSGLQKYSGSAASTKSSIPKWVVFNSALSSVYSDLNFLESQNDLSNWGRKVEQIIGAHLLNEARINDFQLYYWRHVNDEVDYVIKKGKKVITIEVKISHTKFHKGIRKFNQNYKVYRNILISDEVLPWYDFINMDVNSLFK
ncbi:MAG: AAA family ATPase [Melioribacteraceae bacterium]|nr:AAA family ATPase [Melioribacteraceae bacterium]MCF8354024.1 AAA family ATPase [Melioribacteraceae bacterium]MCF8392295.1 AAA family ATPase [Melioribacteraceae bacterium]MCF8417627.1 AAA family ATPase [Melioribacteraceae bacterium]